VTRNCHLGVQQTPSGEQRRKEKDGVFGEGSRATVAISILVKNPDAAEHGRLHYRDIGDYLTREQKLEIIADYGSIQGVPWEDLKPNGAGDWINQRGSEFGAFAPIGSKAKSRGEIFALHSGGLKSNRDVWVYNSSRTNLERNVHQMIEFFNEEVDRLSLSGRPVGDIEHLINYDRTRFSWDRADKPRLARGTKYTFLVESIRTGIYRPFNKQAVYFDRLLNNTVYQLPRLFPTAHQTNVGIVITSPASHYEFTPYMVDCLPDLHTLDTGQFFPRYTYEPRSAEGELDLFDDGDEYRRIDNITDEILAEYRGLYGSDVTKDDIFFFVYGLLHSPDYRKTYAADLKKMLPRIPKLADASDFRAFAKAGVELSKLHLDYESIEQFPLEEIWATPTTQPVEITAPEKLRVTRMKFGGKAGAWDKSTIIFNEHLTLRGIPDVAQEYMLGSRSAIEWILERYQVKTDKDSGIVNDPNDWGKEHGNPRYILDLLKSIVTVSVETVRIVNSLPALSIAGVGVDEAIEDVA
jgi:predicted helicase